MATPHLSDVSNNSGIDQDKQREDQEVVEGDTDGVQGRKLMQTMHIFGRLLRCWMEVEEGRRRRRRGRGGGERGGGEEEEEGGGGRMKRKGGEEEEEGEGVKEEEEGEGSLSWAGAIREGNLTSTSGAAGSTLENIGAHLRRMRTYIKYRRSREV